MEPSVYMNKLVLEQVRGYVRVWMTRFGIKAAVLHECINWGIFFCVLVCSIPFRALIWKPDYINANSHTLPGSGKVLMVPHFDSLISLDSFRFHSLHLSACHHTNGLYLMTVWNTPQISVFSLKSSTKPIIYNLHCLIVQVSLASNSLPLLVYCLSWLVCPLKCGCVCPVRHPAPVLSLFCRQEKAEECQPASIQLLLSYWYSRHIEPSWVSVARAKEECGKWGDRGRGGDASSLSCYLDLKIESILPSFLFPAQFCFHTQPPFLLPLLCFSLIPFLFFSPRPSV